MSKRGVNGLVYVEANRSPLSLKATLQACYPALKVLTAMSLGLLATPVLSQEQPTASSLRVTVNSNQDGAIQADEQLTLREAILLVNGTLSLDKLSDAEKAQVATAEQPRIEFNLPTGETTIRLVSELPVLETPQLVLDGTTQPGYQAEQSTINELPMPAPVVAITPAEGQFIFRGLTITADGVTVRGLSLYGFTGKGFTSQFDQTATTPPADIFIVHRLPPPDIQKQRPPANFSPYYRDDIPPRNVVIENNWLGIPPESQSRVVENQPVDTTPRSAFGVSVFNGVDTVVRRNWIANHDGSGIITGVRAENLQVTENILIGNGVAGMPDAIRLEGEINQAQVTGNLICANDGSGVYLFKPEGAVQIRDNQIIYNGRRFRRAAVYLMGNQHQVTGNQIAYQVGPGVVVTAYPPSRQNQILNNRFTALEGLSIDLVTDHNTGVYDYQRGDGANPKRNSAYRRQDTGNGAVNAPRFDAEAVTAAVKAESDSGSTLLLQPSPAQVTGAQITGKADPGSTVEFYRVVQDGTGFGPLSEPIATVETDASGNFSYTLEDARAGEQISAIATHPKYGTSEPARNLIIRSADPAQPETPTPTTPTSIPRCVTPVPPAPAPDPPPQEPIRLTVPRNIHFALDSAAISPATAGVLDRIAQVLQENPSILVEIRGHTDPRASDAYNLGLGMRRATAARNYLLRRGIAPERMTIRSLGERQRVSEGSTRLDYARDRRAEFDYRDANNLEVIVQEEDLQLEPARGVR